MESAEVGLSPVLIEENGARTQLPTIELNIAPPESPIEVISPAEDNLTVYLRLPSGGGSGAGQHRAGQSMAKT